MNEIELLNDMFNYNRWANEHLLTDLKNAREIYNKDLPISLSSIRKLLIHIYYYDAKTYTKIVEEKLNFNIDENVDQHLLFDLINQYSIKWVAWSRKLYDREVHINGSIMKELLDLYNHNIYHRGQVSAILSMLGYPSASLDIYVYKKEWESWDTSILIT